jgi:hypothetical protein
MASASGAIAGPERTADSPTTQALTAATIPPIAHAARVDHRPATDGSTSSDTA